MITDHYPPDASLRSGRLPSRHTRCLAALFILFATCAVGFSIRGGVTTAAAVRYGASLAALSIAGYLCVRICAAFEAMRRNVAKLRLANAQLAGAQALSQTGSFIMDLDAHSLTWSEQTARILGLPAETPPTIELLLDSVHNADREMVLGMIEDARRGALRIKMAHRIERPDGSVRFVQLLAARSTGIAGHLEYHGALVDITESHVRTAAMQSLHAELTRVARVSTLGELSASLAHEIRQPLGAIALHSDTALRWLSRTNPNLNEATANLGHILASAERATAVVESLRKLSSSAPGEHRPFSLGEAIAGVLPLLRHDLDRTGTTLVVDMPDDLPHVAGDRVQIQQVVLNLVLNGLHAISICDMDQGKIRITGWIDASRMVWLRIRDNGSGIAPADMPHIFNPFFTTKSEGMGMGLPICRRIIANHGGTLSATAHPGETDFTFSLKRALLETDAPLASATHTYA